MSVEKYRLVLAYNTEKDDFYKIDSESSAPESSPILIIDENERKSKLVFPKAISLIQKRTVERRVLSYLKAGYTIDTGGLRIGANFPLEIIGNEVLPEILLTQGHAFGKSKFKSSDNPSSNPIPKSSIAIQEDTSSRKKQSMPLSSTETPVSSTPVSATSPPPPPPSLSSTNAVQEEAKKISGEPTSELAPKVSNTANLTNFMKYFELGIKYEQYFEKIENVDHKSKYKSYYDRFNLTPDHKSYLENNIENQINILIIGAEWCGDCQVNIPIIQHIVQNSKKLSLHILIKENYLDILLTTNGGQHIPYVMFLSNDGYIVERWVERSTEQYQLYADLRKKLGWDNPEFTKESKKLFTHDYEKYSQATANEIIQKIKRVDAILASSSRLHKTTPLAEH